MDEATATNEDSITAETGGELTNFDSLQSIASGEDTMLVSGTPGEVLTRVELDLACFSEKLVNLSILVMHVAMRESGFEAFVSDNDIDVDDSALKALEFDFLSGVLDSEVRELDSFMSTVQAEIVNVREGVSSCKHLGQSLEVIEDKIYDSEESLKQSMDQVSEIRAQSAKYQSILSNDSGEEIGEKGDKADDFFENGDFMDQNAKVKLQTAEQQRHFLRMLEKSLARELDLEKKVGELRQIEEELKGRLQSSEQEAFFMECKTVNILERFFEAENSSEVLMAISKETLSQLQFVQFSLNGSIQREEKLRFELQDLMENMKAKDMEKAIEDLKEKSFRAESRAESAEAECKILSETNMKLNEELGILERKYEPEKVNLLERQLRESEIRLQHSLATADASEEKQSLLYSTINDMENLIEDLKSRVLRAESRAENAEENCIKLSESNSDLSEELNFLRSRLDSLEGSLRQAEETKMTTAKDIGIRTKVITNLVMQLALERERLHKQLSSLAKENKLLSQRTNKDPSTTTSHGYSTAPRAKESKQGRDFLATSFEMEKEPYKSTGEAESKVQSVRNIDARQLNYRYIIMAAIAIAVSALAGLMVNQVQG